MIKAVIFDIDGVLIDSFGANFKFYNEIFKHNGYKALTKDEYLPLFPLTMWDVIAKVTKADENEVKRIWQESPKNYPYESLKSPDGADGVLEELNKQYLLGIVTNRVKAGVFKVPILDRNRKMFKVDIAFEDVKKHKPDPESLILVCNKLGVKPEEAVYVGDQQVDIDSARASGMKVLLFSKENFGNSDLYTNEFKKIPKLLSVL